MNKFRIAISLVVIAGSGAFMLRHRQFQELQTEQQQLQTEDAAHSRVAVPETNGVAAAPAVSAAGLSPEERSELLRLRGQTPVLREELSRETNQLARVARAVSLGPDDEPAPSRQQLNQTIINGREWIVALINYAGQNQDRLPTSLDAAAPFARAHVPGADEFEFVPQGEVRLSTLRRPSGTILLRGKKLWKGNNGRWNRIYAFADGHVAVAQSDSTDFTAWEEGAQRLPDPPPAGQ